MFIDEVVSKLQLSNTDLALPKITLFAKGLLLIEGHKGLLFFSAEEIKFRIKNGTVSILGEGFSLAEASSEACIVRGKIKSVEYA